jgi:hypothetical protein
VLTAALRALQALLAALRPSAPTAAFFLPGTASSLCSILHRATRQGGPRVPPAAMTAALDTLREALMIALAPPLVKVEDDVASEQPPGAHSALLAVVKSSTGVAQHSVQQQTAHSAAPSDELAVVRDAAWLAATHERVHGMLRPLLAPLSSHASPSIRAALSRFSSALVATMTERSSTDLLEILLKSVLCLSMDPAPRVREPCCKLLRQSAQRRTAGRLTSVSGSVEECPKLTESDGGSTERLADAIEKLLPGLHGELEASVLRPEVELRRAARTAAAALRSLPPARAAIAVALSAPEREALLATLERCTELDPAAAALLLRTGATGAPLLTGAASRTGDESAPPPGAAATTVGSPSAEQTPVPVTGNVSTSLWTLPAVPCGLKFIHTNETCVAVRDVPRALGAACAAAWATSGDSAPAVAVAEHLRRAVASCGCQADGRGRAPAPGAPRFDGIPTIAAS